MLTRLSPIDGAVPFGRALSALQLAAVISCATLLFIAFRIGCLRGLDSTIGTDAWGRMLFGIGGAITDQVFGNSGYALGRSIETILSLNGLTGDPAILQNLGVSYPENLRNPALIKDAIEQAASSPYGPGVLRGASGDDPGFIDFVKLSFALFGRTVLSFYLTYFVLLVIEVVAFLVAFRNRPSCLALLTVLLVVHACMINSSLFDHDIGLGSVNNPRFLSTLAIIPTLHVAMLVIWREPMTLSGIILVAIQSLLAALAIWIRSSAAWVIIALLALLAGSLIIYLRRRRREGWDRNLVFSWAIVIFLAIVAGHAIFVRQTLNPVYAEQEEVSSHAFWHGVLAMMGAHPDLDKKFGALFDGAKGDAMPWSASRVYLQRHPLEEQPTDHVDGRLTLAAVEKYSRAVIFEMARQDPKLVAETFFYYKPRLLIHAFVRQLSSLGRNSLSWVSAIALFWAALIARWPGEGRRLVIISIAVSAGFLVSLIPVVIIAGLGPTIADQFYVLLIAAGTWTLSGLALLAQFGHRQLGGWTLARKQTALSSSVAEPGFVAGTALALLAAVFGILNKEGALTLPKSIDGPVVTQETTLAELPEVTTDSVTLIGITGLHAEQADEDPVVTGQSVLQLVAVPTEGRHYLAAQFTGLDENRVYRISAWLKAAPGVKVELELGDGSNHYEAIFDPVRRRLTSSSPGLNGGIEQGPHGWQKAWIDLATVKDQLVLAFGLVSRGTTTFKGNGRLGLTLGGVEVARSPSPGVRNPHRFKQETTLAELPRVTTAGLAFIGIIGLHAERADEDPVVMGQPVLRLIAVPTESRHYLAARSDRLDADRVYRITACVRAAPGVKVELEVADEKANYGKAIFEPAAREITSASPGLKGGVEQGLQGWQKIWIDLATADDHVVAVFGIVSRNRSTFKGDGRLGLTFGGVEVALSPSQGG
jgi:hypothetical protein